MPFSRDIGATLMAAGASSPELFSSFVALFITHSAMGLGTVRHQYSMSIFSSILSGATATTSTQSSANLSTLPPPLFFRLLVPKSSTS
jgi:Ca2+/Na+ antiporter